MAEFKNLLGQRFGRLIVVGRAPRAWSYHHIYWCVECDCGGFRVVQGGHLVAGRTTSCGCVRREMTKDRGHKQKTHGHSCGKQMSPTYSSWRAMLTRCHNPKHPAYERYAGRGITICEKWLTFSGFLEDMGERPSWATGGIDRIDNDGNYEPGNCRWSTRKEQNNNQRRRAKKG